MSLISKIRGITGNLLSIGLGGPNLKNNNNVFEMRNSTDDGYVPIRASDPVGNNDVVTKQYLDNNSLTGSSLVVDDNGNTVSDTTYSVLTSTTHATQTSAHSIIWKSDLLANITSLTVNDVGKIVKNNQNIQITNSNTPTWTQFYNGWADAFGTGIDGNLTLSGSTVVTFTRDMYYNTVTIPSGITGAIITNGWQLFCNILDLRGAPANSLKIKATYNGGSSTGSQAVPITGITSGSVCGGVDGNSAGSNTNGSSAVSLVNYFVNGGNGGNGAAITSGAGGGTARSAGQGGVLSYGFVLVPDLNIPLLTIKGALINGHLYGGQAGGGGASGPDSSSFGGASGAGAGVMRIFARTIITDGYTTAGAINIAGGTGGNSATSGGSYAGGGGGGGGGGYLEIWYETKIGTAVTNLINAAGGTGGTGGGTQYYTVANGGNSGGQGTVLIGNLYSGIVRYRGSISSVLASSSAGASNAYNINF